MGDETVEQVAQRASECHIPESIQDQAGCSSGQPVLVADNPAKSSGVESIIFKDFFNPEHSVIL